MTRATWGCSGPARCSTVTTAGSSDSFSNAATADGRFYRCQDAPVSCRVLSGCRDARCCAAPCPGFARCAPRLFLPLSRTPCRPDNRVPRPPRTRQRGKNAMTQCITKHEVNDSHEGHSCGNHLKYLHYM